MLFLTFFKIMIPRATKYNIIREASLQTALHLAVTVNSNEILDSLLENYPEEVNYRDKNGM